MNHQIDIFNQSFDVAYSGYHKLHPFLKQNAEMHKHRGYHRIIFFKLHIAENTQFTRDTKKFVAFLVEPER